MTAELPRDGWRCVAATPWLTAAADGGGALRPFFRAPYRLPSWVPERTGRHALSMLLPPAPGLDALLRALQGRLFVVNHRPVAAIGQGEMALARALVAHALAAHAPEAPDTGGATRAPWTAVGDDGSDDGSVAAWLADGRAAHAHRLARGWLAARGDADLGSRWSGARAAAVALYEGPAAITTEARGEGSWGGGVPATVLVGAVIPYRLVVVVARDADADALAVAGMDARSRHQWAGATGRIGGHDAYWYPESWARFLEPGRTIGVITAAQVGRSAPSRRAAAPAPAAPTFAPTPAAATTFDPGVDRGLCVPPGYALLDCLGTLASDAVVL